MKLHSCSSYYVSIWKIEFRSRITTTVPKWRIDLSFIPKWLDFSLESLTLVFLWSDFVIRLDFFRKNSNQCDKKSQLNQGKNKVSCRLTKKHQRKHSYPTQKIPPFLKTHGKLSKKIYTVKSNNHSVSTFFHPPDNFYHLY